MFVFLSSRRRHTRCSRDWSSDVCSSDLVTPTVATGVHVNQGQQIGVTDNSGCQLGGHIHMRRTDPSGTPVNFKLPCVNPLPTNNFADGVVDDDVPDNI